MEFPEITNTFYFDIRPCHKCILLMQVKCRNSLQQKFTTEKSTELILNLEVYISFFLDVLLFQRIQYPSR